MKKRKQIEEQLETMHSKLLVMLYFQVSASLQSKLINEIPAYTFFDFLEDIVLWILEES